MEYFVLASEAKARTKSYLTKKKRKKGERDPGREYHNYYYHKNSNNSNSNNIFLNNTNSQFHKRTSHLQRSSFQFSLSLPRLSFFSCGMRRERGASYSGYIPARPEHAKQKMKREKTRASLRLPAD